jgi:hypothetical protein
VPEPGEGAGDDLADGADARRRVFEMRRTFRRDRAHIAAVTFTAVRP